MPKFLADPTHRTKVVAKKVFSLLSLSKKETEVSKADCLRLKKYWGYMLKQNRRREMSIFENAAKAPLEHLFDNHQFCGPWCKRKSQTQEQKQQSQQYYRCKSKNSRLYTQLQEALAEFQTPERLEESAHPFDTQTNEAMNTAVAKYAPKHKTYATSTSLKNRVNIAVGVQVWGYEKFWVSVFDFLGISVTNKMLQYLTSQDRSCFKLQQRKKDPTQKLKRAKAKINSMKEECLKTKKDLEEGRRYGSNKGSNISGDMISLCACPGCPGKKNHKSAKSKECIWHNKFIGITSTQVPSTINQIASEYSPLDPTTDAVDVLANILSQHAMTVNDAKAALQVKMMGFANKTVKCESKKSDDVAKNLPRDQMLSTEESAVDFLVPEVVTNSHAGTEMSTSANHAPMSEMEVESLHTQANKTDFISPTDIQRTSSKSNHSDSVDNNFDEWELLDTIEL